MKWEKNKHLPSRNTESRVQKEGRERALNESNSKSGSPQLRDVGKKGQSLGCCHHYGTIPDKMQALVNVD